MKGIEVWKSNTLLNAKSQWNTQEQKLFNVILSDLNEEKGEAFSITKNEIETLFKVKMHTDDLKNLTKSMVKKGFSIKRGEKSWAEIQIFSSIFYDNGLMILNMTNESLPYLRVLKDYTKFMLEDILNLKSKYSIRVFELMKRESFKKKHSFSMTVEEFREFVGVTPNEYTRFSDFDRYVLKTAEKEINKNTTLKFTYKKIMKWRTVAEIEFIYLENGEPKIPGYMNFKEFNESQLQKIMRIGTDKTIEINRSNSWSIQPEEYIKAQAMKTKEANPKNPFGFFIGSLENDWAGFEDSRNLKLNQISFEDIKIEETEKSKRKVPKKRKSTKDFDEREYDYDDLEKKLLGWDKY